VSCVNDRSRIRTRGILGCLIVLSVLLCSCTSTKSTPAGPSRVKRNLVTTPVGPLGHVGRYLVDATGRVIMLHGVNMVAKRPPYLPQAEGFGQADIELLDKEGFDSLRLGVLMTGLEPEPGHYNQRYIASLLSLAKQLEAAGILPLIDFHQDCYGPSIGFDGMPAWMTLPPGTKVAHPSFPGCYETTAVTDAFNAFWKNETVGNGQPLWKVYAAAVAHVARAFRSQHLIVGFEIMNEPWPGTNWPKCLSARGCDSFDNQVLVPFYNQVAKTMRKAGNAQIVFGEPPVLSNFGGGYNLAHLGIHDVGTSFHLYCLLSGPGLSPLCRKEANEDLMNALAQAKRTGEALLCTEWGDTTNVATIEDTEALFNKAYMSWEFWTFAGSTASANPTGVLVANLEKPPTGNNVAQAALDALAIPYPEALAGSPESYSWSPGSRLMILRYSTAKEGGGHFKKGVATLIRIPASTYPHGYVVKATGARVVIRKPTEIAVLDDPGRPSVTLTLSPRH
jgi:endoglycosylceramidase